MNSFLNSAAPDCGLEGRRTTVTLRKDNGRLPRDSKFERLQVQVALPILAARHQYLISSYLRGIRPQSDGVMADNGALGEWSCCRHAIGMIIAGKNAGLLVSCNAVTANVCRHFSIACHGCYGWSINSFVINSLGPRSLMYPQSQYQMACLGRKSCGKGSSLIYPNS